MDARDIKQEPPVVEDQRYLEKIYELQMEHIRASRKIYSVRRLIRALLFEDYVHKFLFVGEFFWHMSIRADLKKQLPYLREMSEGKQE